MNDVGPNWPGQNPWPRNGSQGRRGAPGHGVPMGPPPGHPVGPGVPRRALSMADLVRNCSFRNGYVHDGVAALLLLVALFLPWNRFFALGSNHLLLLTLAIIAATFASLGSLTLPYLARQGIFGARWTVAHTRLVRMVANAPYLSIVIGFLIYDVVRGFSRFSAGGGGIGAGVGAAVWFGVAGAVLAAQPRATEMSPGRSNWVTAATYLMRTALVLAIVSALVNVAVVFVAGGSSAGVTVKLLASVFPAVLASVAVVGVAVAGLRRDFASGRLVIGAFAVAAMFSGLCLSFGADAGQASSTLTLGGDTSTEGGTPRPVYPDAHPPVLVVLDTSSSMDEIAIGGSTRIQAARDAVDKLIDGLEPDRQFALLSYPGNGRVVDGCSVGDLDIPFGKLNPASAHSTIARLSPSGETPTGPALQTAGQLVKSWVGGKGVIVLVSDGESTCGGDPCTVARQLVNQGLDVQVNTVGFQITTNGTSELECIANATGGRYVPAEDPRQLQTAIADLSSTGSQSGVPWLEYFHLEFGGPDRLGYLGVLFFVAAAAAMVNPGSHDLGRQDVAPGYRWLTASAGLMLLLAIWSIGTAVVDGISAGFGLNSSATGAVVATVVLAMLGGIAALIAVRALQPRRAHGVDPRPSREPVLALCVGASAFALIAVIVRAATFGGSSVGLLDLTGIWLPAIVAAMLAIARPIRTLYADRPLFSGRRAAGPGYPPGYPPPGYPPSAAAQPPMAASGHPPQAPPAGDQDPFSVTYLRPDGGNPYSGSRPPDPGPYSVNPYSAPPARPPDPFSGNGYPPDPFS